MGAESENRSDEQEHQRALGMLREGQVDEGLSVLRELSARMPRVLGEIAFAHRSMGENDKAMSALERYVEKFPDDPTAWSMMARIAREGNDLEGAAGHARRAVNLQPQSADLHFELGEILFHRGDCKGAARAYKRCLKIDPEFNRAQARYVLVSRVVKTRRLRAITWRPPFTWILKWLLSRDLMGDLIEEAMGIKLDDHRWQTPMNWGVAAAFTEFVPEDQDPERFSGHFADCRCSFWQWFRGLPLEGGVRKVLELGVGPGNVAHHFARHGFEVQSLTAGEFARRDREQRGIDARKGDFHTVDERGGTFDLLIAPHTLQHSRSPLFALWEWKRLLRPDGYLFLMARLPLDRPAPESNTGGERQKAGDGVSGGTPQCGTSESKIQNPKSKIASPHCTYGTAPYIMTLTYWQLRWMFRHAGLQLIAETLEEPDDGRLETTEPVDGRRPPDPAKAWNAFFLLRKPGKLPFDGALEKPRPLAPELQIDFSPPKG